MTEFPKLNIICPNCGSPNYMTDISSVSKGYKIKCTNCMKYYKDYDEVIKLHKEKLDEAPDSQKAKSDAGKPQLSLVPRRIIFDIAKIREYGNNKYPEGGVDNWKQVEPERYKDAAFRHFLAYLDDPHGVDSESGLPHLHHLATNIAFLCELEDPVIEVIEREKSRIIAKKVRENADGSVTFKVTKGGQETIDKLLDKISKNKFDNEVVEEEPSKTIPGATVQKYSNGKLNLKMPFWVEKLKDLNVEHMEAEPGWTNWEKAWRDTDSEAEYMRRGILKDVVQFGDYDYETGKIVPRKDS